jgi:hypothetical protein
MNPARQVYAKALADLNKRGKPKTEPKSGGLLQRNKNFMPKEDKTQEPYDVVLDALDQIRTQRKKLKNDNS